MFSCSPTLTTNGSHYASPPPLASPHPNQQDSYSQPLQHQNQQPPMQSINPMYVHGPSPPLHQQQSQQPRTLSPQVFLNNNAVNQAIMGSLGLGSMNPYYGATPTYANSSSSSSSTPIPGLSHSNSNALHSLSQSPAPIPGSSPIPQPTPPTYTPTTLNPASLIPAPPQPPYTPTLPPLTPAQKSAALLRSLRPLLLPSGLSGAGAVRRIISELEDYGVQDVDAATRLEVMTRIRDNAGNHFFRAWAENGEAVDVVRGWLKAGAMEADAIVGSNGGGGGGGMWGETIMPILHVSSCFCCD